MEFDKRFWQSKYEAAQTGWDAGAITTPLQEYIDQLEDTTLEILIPGCGNGYEAEYLHTKGFMVTVVDLVSAPLQNLKRRCPDFPADRMIQDNFFSLTGAYDLILEQTFLSALPPVWRNRYASQMHNLLAEGGKLVGVLFGVEMNTHVPPFGGSIVEYQHLFTKYFTINVLAPCYNSIAPRQGTEVFIHLTKKQLKH